MTTLKVLYQTLGGTLTADIDSTTTLLPVDADTLAALQAEVDFANGDWTYLKLANTTTIEEVKAIGVSSGALSVVRGTSGSTPTAFAAADTTISLSFGPDAVRDTVTTTATPSTTELVGTGVAEVSEADNTYTINVAKPVLVGQNGAVVTGTYPSYTISFEAIDTGCGGGSGGSTSGGVDTVTVNSTSLQASITGTTLALSLPTINLTAGANVSITGTYPDLTIASQQITPQTITVAAGGGITVSGDPTVNPTVGITNTGVAANTYAGIAINARGQITSIPTNFNVINTITFAAGGAAVVTDQTATITLDPASTSEEGIVKLTDSAATFDPTDDSTATTPKVVQQALQSIGSKIQGNTTIGSGLVTSGYTSMLAATPTNLTLAAGQIAMVVGSFAGGNGSIASPTGSPDIALLLKSSAGGAALAVQDKSPDAQTIVAFVTGPFDDVVKLYSTLPDINYFDSATFSISLGFVKIT